MKTVLKILALCIPIIVGEPVFSMAQKKEGFVINGRVDGLKEGMKVYLGKVTNRGTDSVFQTVADKTGHFTFKGKVDNGIDTYKLILDNRLTKYMSFSFHLANESIKISAFIEDWPYIKIAGSNVNDEYKQALKDIKYAEIDDQSREEPVVFTTEEWEKVKATYRNSMIVPLILRELVYYQLVAPAVGLEYFNSLPERIQKNTYGVSTGKYIKEIARLFAAIKAIKPGAVIPDFTIITPDGKSISVLEAARKNKYTLIDFWASWCRPCREEVPNLKKVYKEFKDKGFGIVGVSSDNNEAAWKKALQDDQSPWTHGRNATTDVAEKFSINAIPTFMLLDSQGKLLAYKGEESLIKNFGPSIRGEELQQTLEELLK